jgi:hypothetical protein
MKDTGGPDHIIVRVKLPSGVIQTPVSKDDLYTSPPGKSKTIFCVNFNPNKFSKFSYIYIGKTVILYKLAQTINWPPHFWMC